MSGPQLRRMAFALATLGVLVGPKATGQTYLTQAPPTQTPPSPPWVLLISALAWPVATTIMAIVFRRPLANFLSGLAARVTKLSAFKIELELAAVPNAAMGPLLDDIRSATTPAAISDSSRMMIEGAQSTIPADFAVINLGCGHEWLTSRLFIAAVMLERMRRVQVFVFLENTSGTTRRFCAVASLRHVRWSLAQQFPWLEAAWARASLTVFPASPQVGALPNGAVWLPDPQTLTMTPSPIESSSGALNSWQARQLVSQFITLLQKQMATVETPRPQMQPSVTLGSATEERASWVARDLLETLLPPEAFELWADEGRDAPRMRRTRSVLRRPGSFVALVRGDREYVRLVNRALLLEEVATSLGEEPEP